VSRQWDPPVLLERGLVCFAQDYLGVVIKDSGRYFDFEIYQVVEVECISDNHGLGIVMAKLVCFDSLQ